VDAPEKVTELAADTLRAWALDEELKRRVMSAPDFAGLAAAVASRYSAGETGDDAIAVARAGLARGHQASIDYAGESLTVPHWSEWLEADDDVEVRGAYAGGELDGLPAVTRRPVGDGSAWYVSAMVEPEGMLPIFRDVLHTAGVAARDDTDVDVEVVTRADETTDYTFYLNHGRAPVAFELGGPGTDLLTGIRHDRRLELGRYGVAVLAAPRSATVPFATLTSPLHDHEPKEEA